MNPDIQPSSRPGQMTAVMRAARPMSGPNVLRVALVLSGRVIEERVIPAGASVTVGPNERSTFVVSDPAVPTSITVLAHRHGAYAIEVAPAMSGRVALATGMVSLAHHRGAIALDEGAR